MVTGASGFLGRRCLPLLAQAGFEIHALSSRSPSTAIEKCARWHRYDLLDPNACAQASASIKPTHLLHLAWIATPGQFWNSAANLRWLASSVTLIDNFYQNGGTRAVGVGSCAEYAASTDNHGESSSALRPATIYGRCKLASSLAFEAAAAAHGGSAAWARLFAPYGPAESVERFIPTVIRALLRGEVVACTHGHQVRDFIYVDDVAKALTALVDGKAEGTFNVGSGNGTTLREVAAIISARLGGAELVRFGSRPPPVGDVERVVADIGKSQRELGWNPATTIEAGIEHSIAWWREHQ